MKTLVKTAHSLLIEKSFTFAQSASRSAAYQPVVLEIPQADAGVSASSHAVQPIRRGNHSGDCSLMRLAVLGRPVLPYNALLLLAPAQMVCPLYAKGLTLLKGHSKPTLWAAQELLHNTRASKVFRFQSMHERLSCD